MARRKTTLSLDEDLLRAIKIAAAREDKPEYVVVEEALRKHLGFDVIERIQQRAALSEEEAVALAVDEVRAVRKARRKRRMSRP